VHGSRAFRALGRSRRRAKSGPVTVHYVPAAPADESRYVAYSIPRRVGTAVERNTYRRRLRVVVREVVAELPAGTYLIGVGSGIRDVSFQELRRRVTEAMSRAGGSEIP